MREKQEQYFAKVAEYKARFESMTTDQLVRRYSQGPLIREAQIAVKEVLKELGFSTAGTPLRESN